MTGQFDEKGDLWIETNIPPTVSRSRVYPLMAGASGEGFGRLNLTDYIRQCANPGWLNAVLSSSTAKITIVGNTPTTGGTDV